MSMRRLLFVPRPVVNSFLQSRCSVFAMSPRRSSRINCKRTTSPTEGSPILHPPKRSRKQPQCTAITTDGLNAQPVKKSPSSPKPPSKVNIYPDDHASRPWGQLPDGVLRIVTWNVASLRTVVRTGALQSYLTQECPHILCLQETKMTDAAVANVPELTGYDIHWNHSQKKGYSGVAILVSNDVSRLGLTVERIVPGMGDDIADAEGRVLTAYLTCGLAVVNAYVPNSGGKLARLPYRTETFEPRMRSFVNELAAKYSVLYCGDLNVAHEVIDIHNSKGNQKNAGHTPQERGQFGMLLKSGAGWVDCWRRLYNDYSGYTFYSRRFGPRLKNDKKGWRLDYHVIDKKSFDKDIVHDCFVRPNVDGSDHYPLVVDYEIKKLLQ